ncbi:MAG: hypothetical protein IH949_10645 [Bacteroidetes bacterium]|nr:hypothetical protein [Bacteroidota bacterium]
MKWKNDELHTLDNKLNFALGEFKNNNGSVDNLISVAKNIENRVNVQISNATIKIKNSKYPKSNGFSSEIKTAGEAQKTRAYLLMDKNIELVKSELKKEIDLENWDFIFTLVEGVFTSDRPDTDKHSLSNLYSSALAGSGVLDAINQLKQANILKGQAVAMASGMPVYQPHGITEDGLRQQYIDNIERAKNVAEITYTQGLENPMRPEFQKFKGE